ncbi:coproporphyrinogen III oxidase [Microcoleus sp. FACHB-1515]|uniref:radical SAM family heme chaperone HemW n=1 Tax=Cyanophyceae TaxID=3028117 RepID=UPI0016864B99|nr:radical SAM family heme chaperone HemW [Microcoleus sp. FACHB-1515]MBD2089354.1 coproporphyrinogen III oxidase [Microcoleus sp. FACHB-1515]
MAWPTASAAFCSTTPANLPIAAYIHIPFCRRRCFYCDFPVSILGDRSRGDQSGTMRAYVEALCTEIAATPRSNQPLQTVFFGGGTPSLLSVSQLEQILTALDRQFSIAPDAEISLEIDPDTFDRAQLQGYRSAGVNRVSLGVQSLDADLLRICGRTHTPDDVYQAVEIIRTVEVPSFSLDLISGLPKQSIDQWKTSLTGVIAIDPPHLSVYDLVLEPVTAFGRQYRPGESPLPDDETTAQMYRLAQQMLTDAGYEHYEISNYAKSGYQCRHNRVYWENRSYYGFGMGAASYVNGQRFTRPRKRNEYFEWVKDYVANGGAIDCPPTPAEEQLLDTLMLGFRLAEGLNLERLGDRIDQSTLTQILKILQPYEQQGWLIRDENCLRLSDPEGFLFSNVVLTALFEKLS